MNRAVVVVTGAAPLSACSLASLPDDAIIIAADGALDFALSAGLEPDILVGDLDSVSPAGLEWAHEHATIDQHDIDKDQTDTELALDTAVAMAPARLVMVSGGGDRLDHTLAAIGALGHTSLTVIPLLEAWWGEQYIRVLHGPGRARFDHLEPGSVLSMLALHGTCTGVVATGLKWELVDAEIAPMVGLGVSNVVTGDTAEITLSRGVLTIFTNPPTGAT